MQMPTKRSAFKLGEWQGLSAQPQPPQRTKPRTPRNRNTNSVENILSLVPRGLPRLRQPNTGSLSTINQAHSGNT